MTRLFLEIKNITLCAEPSFFILLYFLCKNLLFCVCWTPLPYLLSEAFCRGHRSYMDLKRTGLLFHMWSQWSWSYNYTGNWLCHFECTLHCFCTDLEHRGLALHKPGLWNSSCRRTERCWCHFRKCSGCRLQRFCTGLTCTRSAVHRRGQWSWSRRDTGPCLCHSGSRRHCSGTDLTRTSSETGTGCLWSSSCICTGSCWFHFESILRRFDMERIDTLRLSRTFCHWSQLKWMNKNYIIVSLLLFKTHLTI